MQRIMYLKLKAFVGFLGLLAVVLFNSSTVLAAGGMEGGGGSAQVALFYKMARYFQASYFPNTASWADAHCNGYMLLTVGDGDYILCPDRLDQLLGQLTIKPVVGPLLLNGEKVDAINFPELKKIELDATSWAALDSASKYQIVIHEILGLLGAEDSLNNVKYRVSEQLAKTSFPPLGNFNTDAATMLFIDNPFWTRSLSTYQFLGITAKCVWSGTDSKKAIEFGLVYRTEDGDMTKHIDGYIPASVREVSNPIGSGLPVTSFFVGQSDNIGSLALIPSVLLKQYFYECTENSHLKSKWVDASYLLGELTVDLIEIRGCSLATAGGASCDNRSEKTERKLRIRKMTRYSPYQTFTIKLLE